MRRGGVREELVQEGNWIFIRDSAYSEALIRLARESSEAKECVRVDLARAGARAGQLSLVVPATRPPLNGLYFDQTGRVWVELLATVEGVAEAILFGRDGVALEVRTWPADVQFSGFGWVGERSALGTAMRDGQWKMIVSKKGVELYDLSTDIGERNNLVESHPERAKQMAAAIEAWKLEVGTSTQREDSTSGK